MATEFERSAEVERLDAIIETLKEAHNEAIESADMLLASVVDHAKQRAICGLAIAKLRKEVGINKLDQLLQRRCKWLDTDVAASHTMFHALIWRSSMPLLELASQQHATLKQKLDAIDAMMDHRHNGRRCHRCGGEQHDDRQLVFVALFCARTAQDGKAATV